MTDLILPRLPKSLQMLYLDYGRTVLGAMVGLLAIALFIGLYAANADQVTRHAVLTIVNVEQRTGNNLSRETVFTVTTPDGGTVQFATQSPAVLRDAGTVICAEEVLASDGRTRWEASPPNACR